MAKTEKEKKKERIGFKALRRLAVFLVSLGLVASVLFTVYCGIGTCYVINWSQKNEKQDDIWSKLTWYIGNNENEIAGNIMVAYLEAGFSGVTAYCGRDTSLRYSIYSVRGRRAGGNLPVTMEDKADKYSFTKESIYGHPQAEDYYVLILDLRELDTEGNREDSNSITSHYRKNFYWIFWGLICGGPLSMILLAMDISLLDRRKKEKGSPIGRIPLEIALATVCFCLYPMIRGRGLRPPAYSIDIPSWAARFVVFLVLSVAFLLYLIRWLQREDWYRNSIIYWIYRGIRGVLEMYIQLFLNLKMIWKICIMGVVITLAELLALLMLLPLEKTFSHYLLLGWALEKLLLTPYLIYHGLALTAIQEAAHEIISGNMNYQTRPFRIPGLLKNLARDINEMSDSISVAVEDRMKSERLKTELITNVSHDIKTPLTSIINFADLIAKEESENPKIQDYADHLYKQSSRMKKLIEDLVEVSKASTGNVETNLELCDVRVLLGQCQGEYESRLKDYDLELVVKLCEEPIRIVADTRMLWRVFDNLMGNICKYAQRETRVYLSTELQGDKVRIIFKNISNYALDIPPEELMERFVRGDLSRHSEGNGLGLSIVRSLMELQKGKIELAVDGDLFKAILEFTVAVPEEVEQQQQEEVPPGNAD